MLQSTYFHSFITICTTVNLLTTLTFIEAKATFKENDSLLESSFDIVDPSVGEEEDFAYVRQVLDKYHPFRQLLPPQGVNHLTDGDSIVIWSPNFPGDYPNNTYQKWIFKPASGAKLFLHCPIIRIRYAMCCKNDRLTVFRKGVGRVRKGERRCGRINDYRETFDSTIKVSFKSNRIVTNIGYFCNITCQIPPTTQTTMTTTTTTTTSTTSTTTTAFSPPIVKTCGDLDPEHIGNCMCTELCGQLLLTCDICTLSDMDVFWFHDISIPVHLKFTFTCPNPLNLSSYYGANADDVVSVTVCVTQYLNNPVDIAFEDLTNLQAVAYRDCSVQNSSCIYDPCNPGDVCQSYEGARTLQTTALQRQNSPITITIPSVSLDGVKELYVADVCLDLTTSPLAIGSMEKLCIYESTECTKILPITTLDCPNLQQISINACQDEVDTNAINIASDIKCLDITLPCTHNLAEEFVVLDQVTCNHDVTVRTKFNEDFYKYIPLCPYYKFLLEGCIDLVFTMVIQCRECGNYWLSKISDDMLARVHGFCYDSVTGQNYTYQEYFTEFTHPCDFLPLHNC